MSGHGISSGMIYVGKLGKRAHWETPKAYINLDAEVATAGEDVLGAEMPYWPSYSEISPHSRLAYLRWLMGGRRDPEYGIGYVFLFFYGLERRLFVDKAYTEASNLIQEVNELREVYGDNGSFDRYSQSFLDAAIFAHDANLGDFIYKPMAEPQRSWELPLRLRVAIGAQIEEKGAIEADLALDWWVASRDRQLPKTVRRVFSELRSVFCLRFAGKYPEGLKFNKPKALIRNQYRSASGDFDIRISLDIPDVGNLTAPLKKIDALAQECIEELKNYSRVKAKNEGKGVSLEAIAQLPADVRSRMPSSAVDKLRAWLEERISHDFASVAVSDIFSVTGVELDGKPTAAKVRRVSSVLDIAGYDLEPHPDFGGKVGIGQEMVVFRSEDGAAISASEAYLSVAHTLSLSVAVANADGEICRDERIHLREMIAQEGKWLSTPEKVRLAAHLEWLIATPPTWASLQAKLKKLPLDGRRLVARFALATAAADGRIDPGEVKLLEKVYALMEVEKNQLYTDLHALEGGGQDRPVSVKAAEPTKDYMIPAQPAPQRQVDGPVVLDMSRIEQIRQDTHQVSQILSEVFAEPEAAVEDVPEIDTQAEMESEEGAFVGLDADHTALLEELMARTHWPREDYERLCTEFGLMAEGAIETINDWAFDAHDDAAIEDGETLEINRELLQGGSA
ncbi:Conserved protein of unknown function [Magnetospira sp. QH-2]|nr:Conserved protein of unknown function [Magnetospira sp. QH-2]